MMTFYRLKIMLRLKLNLVKRRQKIKAFLIRPKRGIEEIRYYWL